MKNEKFKFWEGVEKRISDKIKVSGIKFAFCRIADEFFPPAKGERRRDIDGAERTTT